MIDFTRNAPPLPSRTEGDAPPAADPRQVPAIGGSVVVAACLDTSPELPPAPAASPGGAELGELVASLQRLASRLETALAERDGERLITKDDVAAIYHTTPRTIERWNDGGKIPAPVVSAGGLRWRLREVEEHIRAGMPERKTWEAIAQQLGYRRNRRSS